MIDSDELLSAANPVNERDLPDVGDSLAAEALFRKITGVPYRSKRRTVARRSRPRVWVAALTSALVATGAGVSYALIIHRPTRQVVVGCYAEASLRAHVVAVPRAGSDPIGACRGLWAEGQIPGQPAVTNQMLTECLLPSGVAGVFPDPAGSACRKLRLPAIDVPLFPTAGATTAPTTAQDPVAGMVDSVVSGLSGGCFNADQATRLIRGVLDHAGLASWKVTLAAPFSAERRCASPGFDELNHLVLIVPNPPVS